MPESIVEYKTNAMELRVDEIRKFIAPNLTDQEFWLFINTAKTLDLNPLKREIYPVKYGDKFNIITGYEVYIKRANLSKLLEWWKVTIEKPSEEFKTWIGVFTAKRLDWTQEFEWQVPMIECYKNQATWQTMKEFMLKKTTIGQGLRLLIPEVLAGMPYIAEELGSQILESDYTEIPEEQKIEPEPSEQEAKDKTKNDFLDKLMTQLTEIKTIAELEKKYKTNKKSYESSEMKDSILALFASRKRQLQIEAIQNVTNCGFRLTDIDNWLSQVGDVGPIIDEALAGNADALSILKTTIASYVDSVTKEGFAKMTQEQNEALSTKQDEMDLQEMREIGVE